MAGAGVEIPIWDLQVEFKPHVVPQVEASVEEVEEIVLYLHTDQLELGLTKVETDGSVSDSPSPQFVGTLFDSPVRPNQHERPLFRRYWESQKRRSR